MHDLQLDMLARKLLSDDEYSFIKHVGIKKRNLFNQMVEFDRTLGGVGIHNISRGNTGRYDIEDGDIFRPLQYVYVYFKMRPGVFDWVTREIIHMCGLHLESILKRLVGKERLSLGQLMRHGVVRGKIGVEILEDMQVILRLYNQAKHDFAPRDTHKFNVSDVVVCYAVTRKISMQLLKVVELYTPFYVWEEQ